MQFVLTGFTQKMGFRVFAFARIEANRTRTECTVRADLALSRRYQIPIQALPLLCRNLLERRGDLDQARDVTFTEEEMRIYASASAAARENAKKKTKVPRRPAGGNLGSPWRGHTRPGATPLNPPGEGAK